MTTSFPPPFAARRETEAAPIAAAPTDALDYWHFVLALWRSKFAIAAAGLATAVLVAAMSLTVTSTFTATTQVLLTTRQAQVINIANVVDNPTFTDTAILSEIAIIPSPPILLDVATRLDLPRYAEFNPTLRPPSPVKDAIEGARSAIRNLLSPRAENADEATPQQIAAGILANKVTVSQFGTSYILEIEVESEQSWLAAALANAIAESYIASLSLIWLAM